MRAGRARLAPIGYLSAILGGTGDGEAEFVPRSGFLEPLIPNRMILLGLRVSCKDHSFFQRKSDVE